MESIQTHHEPVILRNAHMKAKQASRFLYIDMDATQSYFSFFFFFLPNLNISIACSAHGDKPNASCYRQLVITGMLPKCWHFEI